MENIKLLPKTLLGKWSIVLIVAMPLFFYVGMSSIGFYESIPAGTTIPNDIVVRPGVALPMLGGFVCGITAFLIGTIVITKKKDYSIFVFLSTIVGFITLLWCLAEITFPH